MVRSLSAGTFHSMVVRPDGSLRLWGSGSPTATNGSFPNFGQVSQTPPGPFLQVASGGYHSLGLRSDRTVVAWGRNDNGQCDVPADLGRCRSLAAGRRHSVALRVLPCVGDVTGDGIHSGQDIGTLFAAFGSNDPVCDLDGDGSVSSLDFSIMLAAWGSCPQE